MDLVNTWDNLSGQSFLFWSATVAVALGVTLILTAGLIQFRKIRSRSRGRTPSVHATEMPTVQEPATTPAVLEKREYTHRPQERSATRFEEQDRHQLLLLLSRLRSAANRLEEFERLGRRNPTNPTDSPLKEARNGVDYLFRAGKG